MFFPLILTIICVINRMDNRQELEKNQDRRKILVNLLRKYLGIWFLTLFLIPLWVTIFAYYQLSYISYVPQKQSEKPPFIPIKSTISTFSETSNPLPLWLIIAFIFCCSSGSFVIFYLLHNSRKRTKSSQRNHEHKKFHSQKSNKSTNFPSLPSNKKNLLIILPPEKVYPLTTESIRKLLNIQDSPFL